MKVLGMKRLAASMIALTLTGTASAVPIVMDITGELTSRSTSRPGQSIDFDYSVAGTAFSAQFIIELDDFGAAQIADTTADLRYSYSPLPGATGISAYLSIGGVTIDVAPYDRSRALVNAYDSKGAAPCEPGAVSCTYAAPDQYLVNLTSIKSQAVGGSSQFRGLQFNTAAIVEPFIPGSGTDFFDATTALSLESILMLPSGLDSSLLNSFLTYTDSYNICTDLCRTDYQQSTLMRIDSLSRYVYGVPEPGTLGLLSLGFAGMLLARRRRGRSTPA